MLKNLGLPQCLKAKSRVEVSISSGVGAWLRREGSEAVMITDTEVPQGRSKVEESEEKNESSACGQVAIAHVSVNCSLSP